MKCLIPLTQETKNEKSLERAKRICDDIVLLYIVDVALIERMEVESTSLLNYETIKSVRRFVIEFQRERAEKILRRTMESGKKVVLHFEVGDYFTLVERYALKLDPDLIMTDLSDRRFFLLNKPLWVETGRDIKKAVFVVGSISKLNTLRSQVSFLKEICKRLGTELYLCPSPRLLEYERNTDTSAGTIRNTLSELSQLTYRDKGDLMIFQREDMDSFGGFAWRRKQKLKVGKKPMEVLLLI